MLLPKNSFFTLMLTAFVVLGISCTDATEPSEAVASPEYIHPAFFIQLQDLAMLIDDLPQTQQDAILSRPEVFLDLIEQALALRYEYTVLVDKQHGLDPDFAPDDLVPLTDYPSLRRTRDDLALSRSIMPMALAMQEAARQDGVQLIYASTYRSYRYQTGLFQTWVNRLGKEEAERVSARAGHSQHQLGTVIDFSPISQVFSGTKDYEWLRNNAHRYGFSLSYPADLENITGYTYESWHWRYIAMPGIRLQREFFDDVQQYYLHFLHNNRNFFNAARR